MKILKGITLLVNIAFPLLFLTLIIAFHPFRNIFSFSSDEGNNLMKAFLLSNGHAFYKEIWSDQPPLFAYMLKGWMNMTEWSVVSARILVVICSSILLWALFQVVSKSVGYAGAVVSCLLLILSCGYVRTSVSVLIGIPSLMFAMLSLYAIFCYSEKKKPYWLVWSAIFLTLSMGIKLWTGILIPVAIAGVISASRYKNQKAIRRPLMIWLGAFFISFTGLFLIFVPLEQAGQLILPHVDVFAAHDIKDDRVLLWSFLKRDSFIFLLGVLGFLNRNFYEKRLSQIPLIWAGLSLFILATHKPLWYHHYLLFSLPMCWAAGIAFGSLKSLSSSSTLYKWIQFATVSIAVILAVEKIPEAYSKEFRRGKKKSKREQRILELMKGYAKDTHYVVTDQQLYPFKAGLQVPPELSVTSLKRKWSGHLRNEKVIAVLEAYNPEQLFLSKKSKRIPITKELLEYIESRYDVIYEDSKGRVLFISKHLNTG